LKKKLGEKGEKGIEKEEPIIGSSKNDEKRADLAFLEELTVAVKKRVQSQLSDEQISALNDLSDEEDDEDGSSNSSKPLDVRGF